MIMLGRLLERDLSLLLPCLGLLASIPTTLYLYRRITTRLNIASIQLLIPTWTRAEPPFQSSQKPLSLLN